MTLPISSNLDFSQKTEKKQMIISHSRSNPERVHFCRRIVIRARQILGYLLGEINAEGHISEADGQISAVSTQIEARNDLKF